MAYTFPFALVNGTAADATQLLANMNTLLGAANLQLAKDGSVALIANLQMNGFRLNGLTAGAAAGDSVEFGQMNAAIAAGLPATPTFTSVTTGTLAVTGAITFSTPLPLTQGGTGATTMAALKTALALGTNGSGNRTLSTAAPSGVPANGDVWEQYS